MRHAKVCGKKNSNNLLVRKLEGRRSLGRSSSRGDDIFKLPLKLIGGKAVDSV
jgi:hypothetical protein